MKNPEIIPTKEAMLHKLIKDSPNWKLTDVHEESFIVRYKKTPYCIFDIVYDRKNFTYSNYNIKPRFQDGPSNILIPDLKTLYEKEIVSQIKQTNKVMIDIDGYLL